MNEVRRTLAARLAKNLVSARKRAGLSQEEVGYRSLLHRTQIGVLERGERLPQLDTILKLAGGLAVSPCDLDPGHGLGAGAAIGRRVPVDRLGRGHGKRPAGAGPR